MRQTWTADDGTTFESALECQRYEELLRAAVSVRTPAPKATPKASPRPVKAYVSNPLSGPLVLEDIKKRVAAGESFAAIGEVYNVSRQRVQQFCKKHAIEKNQGPSDEQVQAVYELLRQGKSRTDALKEIGIGASPFARRADLLGLDIDAAVAEGRTHRYDNQTFGWWSVLPGSYLYDPANSNARSVECVCICGTRRRVTMTNLLNRASRGCGCRSSKQGARKRVPWVCQQTGERLENTAALAKRHEIAPTLLYRLAHRDEPYVAADGSEWTALPEEATVHELGSDTGKPWVDLDSGRVFESAADVARSAGVHQATPGQAVNKRGKAFYTAPDGRRFAPKEEE